MQLRGEYHLHSNSAMSMFARSASPIYVDSDLDTDEDDDDVMIVDPPAARDTPPSRPAPAEPDVPPQGSLLFKVEKILGTKTDESGKRYFHIKWKGYSEDENTWELEEDLRADGVPLDTLLESLRF